MSAVKNTVARRSGWIALIVLATLVGSFVFTCATPFAALAALAALHMQRRDAFILIGMNWLANQAVGFGLLNYPRTWDCLAGGLASAPQPRSPRRRPPERSGRCGRTAGC